MLADPHLTVPHYVPNSDELFPGTIINGGIAVTYRDEDRDGEPIGTFAHYPELNTILHKVVESGHRLDGVGHHEFPLVPLHREALRRLPRCAARFDRQGTKHWSAPTRSSSSRSCTSPSDPTTASRTCVSLGLDGKKRASRWIRSDYVTGPENLDKYKVVAPCISRSPREVRRGTCPDPWRAPARRTAGCGHPDLHHHRIFRHQG